MQYQVDQRLIWNCRAIDVRMQTNRQNGSKFVLVKLGKYEDGDFLCSVILNERVYNSLMEEMRIKKLHTIERLAIRPSVNVYHILNWDDIDRHKCVRDNIGEIERNNKGQPIAYNQIVIFTNIDGKYTKYLDVENVLSREYLEVNSPYAPNALKFNNRAYFLAQREERNRQEEEKWEEMMADMYDAYENHRYDDMDMSPEERVMSALENGMGELYGY